MPENESVSQEERVTADAVVQRLAETWRTERWRSPPPYFSLVLCYHLTMLS